MNEVIIAAIAAGLGSVITIVGKVIVDIIKAKKEPDEADMELKNALEKEKEKNDKAIETFNSVASNLTQSIRNIQNNIQSLKDNIESYRSETREINKSSLRHSITEIYFENRDQKKFDMRTKDDLCSLYEAYKSIGGNSFAHELYEEMMSWDVK